MLKIVLIGPESTGKTTLAKQLAAHYGAVYVEEFARTYINNLNRDYTESDLYVIAKGQMALEDRAADECAKKECPKLFFLDTNLIVLKIWSLNAYQRCDEWILNEIEKRSYDLYFLCGIDVPWEYDEQREHPHLREYFYRIYKKELLDRKVKFVELCGSQEERLKKAIKAVEAIKRCVSQGFAQSCTK
jgi:nicotinamide riboside kinase